MCEGRKIAARPDGSLLRNDRPDAAVEHLDEKLDDFEADPAEAESEHIGPQQHHGAHLRLGERTPDAAGMASHEVDLELLEFVGRDVNVGQLAEPGADAINHLTARDDLFHHSAGSVDRGVCLGRDLDRLPVKRDASDFFE